MFDLSLILIVFLNIMSYGAVLVIAAIGLNFIYGLLDHPNLAHGAMFAFGGYLAYQIVQNWGSSLWVALPVDTLIGAVVFAPIGYILIRPYVGKDPNTTLVVSLGFSLIIVEVAKMFWGLYPLSVNAPAEIPIIFPIGNFSYSGYRVFVLALGIGSLFVVYYLLNKTDLGLKVRSCLESREIASISGVNVQRIQLATYMIGAALALLAGTAGGPMFKVHFSLAEPFQLFSFAIVITGGVGCFRGTVLSAFIVSAVSNIIGMYAPPAGNVAVFVLMFSVLAVMPTGILRKGRRL